jgi:hypothetical protein
LAALFFVAETLKTKQNLIYCKVYEESTGLTAHLVADTTNNTGFTEFSAFRSRYMYTLKEIIWLTDLSDIERKQKADSMNLVQNTVFTVTV